MSNAAEPGGNQPETVGQPGRSGPSPATTPSTSKKAKRLNPDRPVWERQLDESREAYEAFIGFRDSEQRKVRDHGPHAYEWSSQWHWGHRAYQYDLYLHEKDQEDAVRYRLRMNERQRASARLAQNKIAQFLIDLDPSKLSPMEAVRWFEVAVKVERMAGGEQTSRVGVDVSGQVTGLTAEETREQLRGVIAEIEALMGSSEELPDLAEEPAEQ